MAEIEKTSEVSLAPEYKALQDAFEQLQKKISPGGIVGALYARNLLLFNEVDTIRSKAVNVEKNEELLLAMCRRSPDQVLQFCQFLLEEQYHCGEILQKALQARGVDTSSLTVATLEPSAVSHVAPQYYPQIDDLDVALGALVQKIKDATKDSQILKTYCIRFLTTLSRIHSHDTKDTLDRLATPDCQNDEAIDIIQRFVDPLDCRLLYQIVSALEDEQLTKAWDEYCQRSKQACRTTLEQCRKVAIRPHRLTPIGITLGMQTKISPPDITIQKIVQLKEFLVTKVGLEESVFQGFANSAVALFFTVGRERLPLLIRLLSRHQKALLDFSITTVFVPGEFFYDVAKDQEFPYPKDEKAQESTGTLEQASAVLADVEARFSAAVERLEHAQIAVQKKEELVHMERKEVEKERLQDQVQSLVHDNLKLQDENRLLEKQLFQRLDALQEMMMDRVAEAPPQEERERPEKDETYLLEKKILERLDALQEMMMGRSAEAPPQEEEGVTEKSLPSYVSGAETVLEEPSMVTEWKLQRLRQKEYLMSSLEDVESLEGYGMKAKTRSSVPLEVKTLRERNKELAEKEEALKERDTALSEKEKIAGTLATMQGVFEEVQSAFSKYGIEVVVWEDVPIAVQTLAQKQGKDPLPDALLQTAAGSEIVFLQEMVNLSLTNWPKLAAHLGCTASYIDQMYERQTYRSLDEGRRYVHVDFPERCFYNVTMDWAYRKEGTGNRPRNWKTVLESFRRLCIGSDEKLSKLASFEKELISGIKQY